MNISLPILAAALLMFIACLYVKGKEDAETFDGELRYFLACIHLFPVTDVAFETIQKRFSKINKIKRKDREQVSVAFTEFAFKFRQFFPALGAEAEIKNTE